MPRSDFHHHCLSLRVVIRAKDCEMKSSFIASKNSTEAANRPPQHPERNPGCAGRAGRLPTGLCEACSYCKIKRSGVGGDLGTMVIGHQWSCNLQAAGEVGSRIGWHYLPEERPESVVVENLRRKLIELMRRESCSYPVGVESWVGCLPVRIDH